MASRTRTLFRIGPVALEFKPADCWVGAFWKRDSYVTRHRPGIDSPALPAIGYSLDVWVCLLPMLPLHYARHWR